MGRNPNETVHPKENLSLELNFRSFLFGEGAEFFEPVPVEELVNFAALGCPVTIPEGGPYTEDDLVRIAQAVRQGGTTLTVVGAPKYPAEVLARLEKEVSGRILLA